MTGQRDDDARCWDCGHPWDTDCGCLCCSDSPLDDCSHGYIRQTCMTCITGGPDAV